MTCSPQQLLFDLDLGEVPRSLNEAFSQRWRARQASWVRPEDGGFDARRYWIEPIDEQTAKAYVQTNHYSASYPAASRRFGLFIDDASSDPLVGVAVFGIPPHRRVLEGVFPLLEPYSESLELSRFVLEGEVGGAAGSRAPANAESWFLARCFSELAATGLRGVVAFSDPVPRRGPNGIVLPGHTGAIYQAMGGAIYTGRGRSGVLTLLPDGTVLNQRSLQKIRGQERGHEGVERRLCALGARPRRAGETPRAWLSTALEDLRIIRLRHPGCHRYAFALGMTRRERRQVLCAMPGLSFPKRPDRAAA
ncbi:MAG: hypothetical protein M0014_02035 [Actinomycetota bacterium]|jgi:hypothetical protein|nr:hypothetical protein [Actinomycetota bacterium]